jgi:hypothetical protein
MCTTATTAMLASQHHASNHGNQNVGAKQQPTKKITTLQ